MCRELVAAAQLIAQCAEAFDARCFTPAEAGQVVRRCSGIEASVVAIKAQAAAVAAEADDWKAAGYRSAADRLAQQTGASPSNARRTLETGRRLLGNAEVAKAAATGRLSPEQAALVAAGAEADPDKADELIEAAHDSSLRELQEKVAAVRAAACDTEERRRQRKAARSLRRWTNVDGGVEAHLSGPVEDGSKVWRMLDPIRRRLMILRRTSTANERLDALDYDALMTVVDAAIGDMTGCDLDFAALRELGLFPQLGSDGGRGDAVTDTSSECPPSAEGDGSAPEDGSSDEPSGNSAADPQNGTRDDVPAAGDSTRTPPRRAPKLAGGVAKIIVRVDLDTLLRGVPLEGEFCELVDGGPIPVSVIEELLAQGAFLAAVLTRGERIVGVYHHGRFANSYQRTALEFLYPSCAVKGCSTKVGLQNDHRLDWVKTHYTTFDLLDRLCRFHHGLKTHRGWGLVAGTGKRAFVPPSDPRHPEHGSSVSESARPPSVCVPP